MILPDAILVNADWPKLTPDTIEYYVEVLRRRATGGRGSGNFGHSGRPGQVGGSGAGGGDVTQSRAFKRWFGKSKVVDEDGKPLVVYHGTTHAFTQFKPAGDESLNPESDWGQGAYFSNSAEDVSENYAGVGPDLTSRIEQRAEQIQNEDEISHEAALERARAELVGSAGAAGIPVYLSMQNPFVLGTSDDNPVRETYLENEFIYEDPKNPESDIIGEKGPLTDFITGLKNASRDFDDTDGVYNFCDKLVDYSDGISASKLDEMFRKSEDVSYVADQQGRLARSELFRRALQNAGFDGVVDRTVNKKFGTESGRQNVMAGMHEGTVHYVAFNPTQIKSAIGNRGTFDQHDPDITKAKG